MKKKDEHAGIDYIESTEINSKAELEIMKQGKKLRKLRSPCGN